MKKIHGPIVRLAYDINIVNLEAKKNPKKLIATAEKFYHDQINSIVKKVVEKQIKIIKIAGPSASGKTTTAKLIASTLKKVGIGSVVIAIVLVLGNLINTYPALGSMAALNLTAKQCTVISGMILISHALIMEGMVIRQSGVSPWGTLVLRFCASILFGLFLNLIL